MPDQAHVHSPPPAVSLPAAAPRVRRVAATALDRIECAFDVAFGSRGNPWRRLGALAWFLFWVVAASGIYIYIGFDTRADGAYASVARLSENALDRKSTRLNSSHGSISYAVFC